MGRYPDDVVQFIARRFHRNDITAAYRLLDHDAVRTLRMLRAVLYLADGSLSSLRHHIAVCNHDPGRILIEAECVVGVGDAPMPVRDLSQPLPSPPQPRRHRRYRPARDAPRHAEAARPLPPAPVATDLHIGIHSLPGRA
ncbi:MAG: hypothetical protein HC809_02895 [Gammaproteobacteria bacterium]|nr:hypothetical protein [Gammaproteobacteria bacterium]